MPSAFRALMRTLVVFVLAMLGMALTPSGKAQAATATCPAAVLFGGATSVFDLYAGTCGTSGTLQGASFAMYYSYIGNQ